MTQVTLPHRRGRWWTREEDQFLIDNVRTLGFGAVADALGRTRGSVKDRAGHKLGIWMRYWPAEHKAFLRKHYPTHGADFVAEALGRPKGVIVRMASNMGVRRLIYTKVPIPDVRTKQLLKTIAPEHGFTPEQILSRARNQAICAVRYRIARELRNAGYSFPNIGKRLGLDHSSVIWGIKRFASGQS